MLNKENWNDQQNGIKTEICFGIGIPIIPHIHDHFWYGTNGKDFTKDLFLNFISFLEYVKLILKGFPCNW